MSRRYNFHRNNFTHHFKLFDTKSSADFFFPPLLFLPVIVGCFAPFIGSVAVIHFYCNIKHPVTRSLQSPGKRKATRHGHLRYTHGQSEPEDVTGENTESCNWGGRKGTTGQQRAQEAGGEVAYSKQVRPWSGCWRGPVCRQGMV